METKTAEKMTADQKFTLLLTSMGLLFTMLSVAIGLIWRNGNKAGRATIAMKGLAEDVKKIAQDLDGHIQWHMRDVGRRSGR
jgi:hypothetical protein